MSRLYFMFGERRMEDGSACTIGENYLNMGLVPRKGRRTKAATSKCVVMKNKPQDMILVICS